MNRNPQRGTCILSVKKITGATVVTGAVIGYAVFWGTAIAHAVIHQVTAHYSCSEPNTGTQSASATWVLSSNFPNTVTVGRSTPTSTFSTMEQIPAPTVNEMRRYYGIYGVKGSGTASIVDVTPQGNIKYTVNYTIPPTSLPASGAADITAYGTVPSFTYSRPGTAKSTVGQVTVNQTALDANGNPTMYGTQNLTCTPASGQNTVIQTFQIDPAPKSSVPPPETTRPQSPAPAPTTTMSQHHHSRTPARKPSASPTRTSASPSSSAFAPKAVAGTVPSTPGPSPRGTNWDQIMIIGGSALASAGAGALAVWLALRNRP